MTERERNKWSVLVPACFFFGQNLPPIPSWFICVKISFSEEFFFLRSARATGIRWRREKVRLRPYGRPKSRWNIRWRMAESTVASANDLLGSLFLAICRSTSIFFRFCSLFERAKCGGIGCSWRKKFRGLTRLIRYDRVLFSYFGGSLDCSRWRVKTSEVLRSDLGLVKQRNLICASQVWWLYFYGLTLNFGLNQMY